MTTNLDRVIERYYRAREAWANAVAVKEIELHGTVPEAVFSAHLRQALLRDEAELMEELVAATIANDQAHADLKSREVDAVERNVAFWASQRERA